MTHDLVLSLINFKHGTQFTRANWTFWDWSEFGLPGGDKDFWAVYDLMDETHLRRAIRPTSPFAAATMKWLVQRGHFVELVTSNSPAAAKDMQSWLFGHGLDIPVNTIGRGVEKATLDYDLFIDDAPSLASAIRASGTDKRLLLYEQPWNVDVPSSTMVIRFTDWADARALLLRMGL